MKMPRTLAALGAALALVAVTACQASEPSARPEAIADPGHTNLSPPPPNPEARKILFAEFETVALKNCELDRIGGDGDGGYLACANLLNRAASGYSYGIANSDTWGCSITSKWRIPVHQYDCFDTRRPSCTDGVTMFHDECVAEVRRTEEGRLFDTVAAQVERNGDTGKRLVVKMDVEGAEWASLLATPDAVLSQIDQLILEFHRVDDPRNVETVRKLKRFFHIVHVHYNNYACSADAAPFPAWAFQVLMVNKEIGEIDPAAKPRIGPHPLDRPDDPKRPDCQPQQPTESRSPR